MTYTLINLYIFMPETQHIQRVNLAALNVIINDNIRQLLNKQQAGTERLSSRPYIDSGRRRLRVNDWDGNQQHLKERILVSIQKQTGSRKCTCLSSMNAEVGALCSGEQEEERNGNER